MCNFCNGLTLTCPKCGGQDYYGYKTDEAYIGDSGKTLKAVIYLETHRSYIKDVSKKIILVAGKEDAKVFYQMDANCCVEKLKKQGFLNPSLIYV